MINIQMRVRDLIIESDLDSDDTVDFSNPKFNFDNSSDLMRFLWKKQLTACHEFEVYVQHMFNKHKLTPNGMLDPKYNLKHMSTHSVLEISIKPSEFSKLSDHERTKFLQKRDRMIHAKRKYESAGGQYN